MIRIKLATYRKAIMSYDEYREKVIKQSRVVLRCAKRFIYAVHRGETTAKLHTELASEFKKLNAIGAKTDGHANLVREGAYSEAAQEYVEACVYHDYVKKKTIRTAKQLGVTVENYLLGVCDVSGELVRKAVNAVINDNISETLEIEKFVDDMYAQMLTFNFRNGHLRKKVDGMKYAVRKLQDVIYDIKIKGK
jgi:predicted translin family RNA/ssDNA-binding protein